MTEPDEGNPMAYDLLMLKAAADAASNLRLEQADAVVDDEGAPRRALAFPRAESPIERLGAVLDDLGRADLTTEWADRFGAADAAVTAWVEGVNELAPQQRQDGYDALDADLRDLWDRTWRAAANEWLEVLRQWGTPTQTAARPWSQFVYARSTTDGGQLLLCATHESDYGGPPAWFEAVQFSFAEVATAAGFHEPTYFDVT